MSHDGCFHTLTWCGSSVWTTPYDYVNYAFQLYQEWSLGSVKCLFSGPSARSASCFQVVRKAVLDSWADASSPLCILSNASLYSWAGPLTSSVTARLWSMFSVPLIVVLEMPSAQAMVSLRSLLFSCVLIALWSLQIYLSASVSAGRRTTTMCRISFLTLLATPSVILSTDL